MTGYQTVALLVSLAALFSYLNYRFVRLPTTIGVMVIALGLSLALVVFSSFEHLGDPIKERADRLLPRWTSTRSCSTASCRSCCSRGRCTLT